MFVRLHLLPRHSVIVAKSVFASCFLRQNFPNIEEHLCLSGSICCPGMVYVLQCSVIISFRIPFAELRQEKSKVASI